MTTTPTERALRRQLDEALEEIERLRQRLETRPQLVVPAPWGLTPAQAEILIALCGGRHSKQQLMNVLYGDRADGGPKAKILDVHICRMRQKLARRGIEIVTVPWAGYELADRAAVRAMLAAEAGAANDNSPEADAA